MTKQESLLNLLGQVKEVLDEHNVEFWLDCGTLLGAIRDGKFIPWEHDIDFGAWHEKVNDSVKSSLAQALRKQGLKVWIAEDHMNIIKEKGICADINFYQLNNDKAIKPALFPKNLLGKFLAVVLPVLWVPHQPRELACLQFFAGRFLMRSLTGISRAIPSSLRKRLAQVLSLVYEKVGSKDISWVVPTRFFSQLSTLKFYGMQFKVPDQPQDYLAYRYGTDWEVPRKDFDTVAEDKSFAINQQC